MEQIVSRNRERYYSSMDYEEYQELFCPESICFKYTSPDEGPRKTLMCLLLWTSGRLPLTRPTHPHLLTTRSAPKRSSAPKVSIR